MITLRSFRPEDASGEGDIVRELLTEDDPLVGVTVLKNGQVAAYGGVRLVHNHHWAFFNIMDQGVRSAFLIHRTTAAAIIALTRSGVGPVYTFCDQSKPKAEAWLRRLGFRPLMDEEKNEVLIATETQVGHGAWVLEVA